MRFSILLIGIGTILALYSHSLPVYYNESAFLAEVAQIGEIDAAQHFYIIQDSYLSAKYVLLDYSITSFLVGTLWLLISNFGFSRLSSPKHKTTILIIGITAASLSVLAFYTDSFVNIERDLNPPWYNDMLPTATMLKKVMYFFVGWLTIHSVVLIKDFRTGLRFTILSLDYIGLGLLSSTILSGGFSLITLVGGQPIYALPALLWFYFHLSLLVGKQSTRRME